jgi:hypothetical protein
MALGTLLPIVHIPIIGTMSYVAQGKGDGTIILALSPAIIGLVIFSYRRLAAALGGVAIAIMCTTLLKLSEVLYKLRGDAAKLAEDNPFGGLASMFAQNAGPEWGWVPLFSAAFVIVGVGLLAPKASGEAEPGRPQPAGIPNDAPLLDADEMIARYIDLKSARRQRDVIGSAPTFGKRNMRS